MDVNFNAGQTNLLNSHRINQSIATHSSHDSSNRLFKAERTDRISISPQGKKNSLLDNLMKQKMSITEQKNSLIHSTLEKGGTLDTIQSQIAHYDEQLKTIDDQITKLTASELKKKAEKAKNQEDSKPKTEEEIQKERLTAVVSLAENLQQTKTIRSVQSKVNGEARVLKSEIELDHMHSGSSPGATEMIAKKEERLASLEQKSMSLSSEVSNRQSDVGDKKLGLHESQETLPNNRKGESALQSSLPTLQAKPPSLQAANLDSKSDQSSAVKAPSAKKSADQIPSWMKDTGRLMDLYA